MNIYIYITDLCKFKKNFTKKYKKIKESLIFKIKSYLLFNQNLLLQLLAILNEIFNFLYKNLKI